MATKALRTTIGKLFLLIALIAVAGVGSFNATVSANSYPLINGGKPVGGSLEQVVSSGEISMSAQRAWTREEMLSAIPYPVEKVARAPKAGDPVQSTSGPEVKIPGTMPKGDKGGKKVSDPLASGDVSAQYTSGLLNTIYYQYYPFRTVGKVFFTSGGQNFVCSASVMGNNALWTAGHCVYDPNLRTWHTNWVFVPAYLDGSAPYGQWRATQLTTTNGWASAGSLAFDIGSAVVAPINNTSIANTVGALGWLANAQRGLYITAMGYPQAAPFTGQRMAWCRDYTWIDYAFTPTTDGMGCNMTGGSSGGPWIYDYEFNTTVGNYVNGVNSYKYSTDPYSIYSPYFGDAAINLYNSVINR